jgi:DNA-binding transcriptional LysR family regulator
MVPWDLQRLRILRELAERRTLAAVADALGYSPSAISQQLAVLEREAGTALLQRAGRGVRLTDAGRVLADHADLLLAAAEAARVDVAALSGDVRGTVRAGGLQSALRHLLIPTLAGLLPEHPGIQLELTEIELEPAVPELRLGTLDLVVSDEYAAQPRPRPAGIRREVLLEEPLVVVLPVDHPRSQDRRPVSIASLRDEVWVASASGTGHHALVLAACRELGGFDPELRHRSNDADMQLEIVRTAGGVALMPSLTVPLDDPTLAIRHVADGTVARRLLLLTRDQPTPGALAHVLDSIRTRARSLGRTFGET